jgi:hypothetical protein
VKTHANWTNVIKHYCKKKKHVQHIDLDVVNGWIKVLKKHDSLMGKIIHCCHHRNVVHVNAKHQQRNDNGYW